MFVSNQSFVQLSGRGKYKPSGYYDSDAADYFTRLSAAGGGSVTDTTAYHTFFSKLKSNNLFPEEIIPLDGDNIAGVKVKGYISSLASHTTCQDSGISGQTGSSTFAEGNYTKSSGLTGDGNDILCCGIDANNFNRRDCTLVTVITTNGRNNTSKVGGTTGGGSGWGFLHLNKSANNNQAPMFVIDGSSCDVGMNVLWNTKGIHIGVGHSAGSFWYANGRKVRTNSTLPTSGTFATNQVRIFPGPSTRISLQMYYRRALSDSECLTLNTLIAEFEALRGRAVYTDNITNVWCWGDSLTWGYQTGVSQITQPYPYQLTTKRSWVDTESLSTSRQVANRGVSGKTAATWLSELNSGAANTYNFLTGGYNPNSANIAIVEFGTNDLGNSGVSAATLKTTMDSICTKIKSTYPGMKVIVVNVMNSASYVSFATLANYNAQAPTYNALLAADSNYTNGTLADGIADISTIPDDLTHRHDGVHWTNTGAGLAADAVITVLTTLGYA